MDAKKCRESLLAFVNTTPSPFHVVNKATVMLRDAGFQELKLGGRWHLREGDSYFVNAFGSTLVAFRIGRDVRSHMRLATAHTDFPNIRIKPEAHINQGGYLSLNVEMYGGLALQSWLDRPLSIAGKVVLRGENPFAPRAVLVDVKRPVVTIPGLAIHLNRQLNDGIALNRQTDMLPIAADTITHADMGAIEDSVREVLQGMDLMGLLAEEASCEPEDILFYELGLYPTEQGCSVGFHEEFISSPRLDNLTSVKACLEALIEDTSNVGLHVIALFDNEEVGSRTKQGAGSALLPQILQRIYLELGHALEDYYADVVKGFQISVDVAHGYHPNYANKYDITNKPVLNGGFAIKFASAQTYAGDAEAVATIKALCEEQGISYQVYVNRSDIPGGSTLGSITSAMLPMRTMDVGVPLLSMHSVRELMGQEDQVALEAMLTAFFAR